MHNLLSQEVTDFYDQSVFFFVGVEIPIRSEKEKFLSQGGPPEVSCFPIF